MPSIDDLRLRTGQLVTEDWFDTLCDLLQEIGYEGVISLYGYVMKDLVPYADLILNLGLAGQRFKDLNAGYGYFTSQVLIDGKVALKDGDPITVSDFGTSAATKIKDNVRDGVNASVVQQCYEYIRGIAKDGTLAAFKDEFIPILLNKLIETPKTEMADIFTPNITVTNDGRVRTKIVVTDNAYAYIKHKATGETSVILGCLNAGVMLPANCWHEFDFTAMKNDQVNFQITPGSLITILVYNIPNA